MALNKDGLEIGSHVDFETIVKVKAGTYKPGDTDAESADISSFTKAQIIENLEQMGVQVPVGAKKDELVTLFQAQ